MKKELEQKDQLVCLKPQRKKRKETEQRLRPPDHQVTHGDLELL